MERLYLSPPFMCGGEQAYVQQAFDQNWIAPLGPNVTAFEKQVAEYVGVSGAVAMSSGTAAIHLALRYYGVSAGDFVICSDLTFAGSCNPILYQAATPVFVDSDPETLNMSAEALENALTWCESQGKPAKAAIIVDLYGQSADYDKLLPLLRRRGIPVIEDAAEALGADYKGRKCGSLADVGIFSFNGNKIVTTSGGGMAVSNDAAALEKMLFWATQAREKAVHYEHRDFGYNYRLSNVCAGIGRGQMDGLPHKLARRREINETYRELLRGLPLKLAPVAEYGTPNYWMTVAMLNEGHPATPESLCLRLDAANIEARPAWKPMHMQPVFADAPYFAHPAFDVGARAFGRGLCLPSGEALTVDQQSAVVAALKGALA